MAANLLHFLYGDDAAASVAVFQILLWTAPFFLVEMYAVTQLMATGHPRLSLRVTWVHILIVLLAAAHLDRSAGRYGRGRSRWSLPVQAATSAASSCMRQASLPLHVPHIAILLAATCIAGLLAMLLPLPWLVRALLWRQRLPGHHLVTGVFAPSDRQIFRDAFDVAQVEQADD